MFPFITIQFRRGRNLQYLAEKLADEFPNFFEPEFGSDKKIIKAVCCETEEESNSYFEVTVFFHDFLGDINDLKRRREEVLQKIRTFLADYDRNISGIVFLTVFPTTISGKI